MGKVYVINEKGAALIIALLIMAVLSLIGAAATMTSSMETNIAGNQKASTQAFYVAEAGLERFKAENVDDLDWGDGVILPDADLGSDGHYTVTIVDPPTPTVDEITVRSEGTFSGAKKVLQACYQRDLKEAFKKCLFADTQDIYLTTKSGGKNSPKYIEGDIHSNRDVNGNLKGDHYIDGYVSAVGLITGISATYLSDEDGSGNNLGIKPSADEISFPEIDFNKLSTQADETITPFGGTYLIDGSNTDDWLTNSSKKIIYIQGDVKISNSSIFDDKIIVATGDIEVDLWKGHTTNIVNASLIAQGKIAINEWCGGHSEERGVRGLIYSASSDDDAITVDMKSGGNNVQKKIEGALMTKGGIDITLKCGGNNSPKKIVYNPDAFDDLIDFFQDSIYSVKRLYWREITY